MKLIAIAKNEELRLPYWLQHYHSLGFNANDAYIIDNGSTDNTLTILQNAGVHIISLPNGNFYNNYGMDWIEDKIKERVVDDWILGVDIDELFIYPDYENTTIQNYCANIQGDAVQAIFLDMVPDKPINEAVYTSGSFFNVAPLFSFNTVSKIFGISTPQLKVPLFRYVEGQELNYTVNGRMNYNQLANKQCAVLNFKYFSDIVERANNLSNTDIIKAHKYFKVRDALNIKYKLSINPSKRLDEDAIEFINSQQLVNLQLMK